MAERNNLRLTIGLKRVDVINYVDNMIRNRVVGYATRFRHIHRRVMKSRADRIYLAYTVYRTALEKEGLDRVHGRTLLYLAERFNLSPLTIQAILNNKKSR